MSEQWKEWKNNIFVSNYGRVKVGNKIAKPYNSGGGYQHVWLNGKARLVNRLVAELFVPKVEGKDVVSYKDNNPKNVRADNLMWASRKDITNLKAIPHRPEFNNRTTLLNKKDPFLTMKTKTGKRYISIHNNRKRNQQYYRVILNNKTYYCKTLAEAIELRNELLEEMLLLKNIDTATKEMIEGLLKE